MKLETIMKNLIILFLMCYLISACGRQDATCRSKEHMRIQCQAQNTPNYGYPYSVEMCNRSYESDRCW